MASVVQYIYIVEYDAFKHLFYRLADRSIIIPMLNGLRLFFCGDYQNGA